MDELKPGLALWTGIPGSLAMAALNYLTGWRRDCVMAVGVVLCGFACAILLVWLRDHWIRQTNELRESRDRILLLAREARHMTQEQLAFVKQSAHIGVDRDVQGESYLRGTDAPLWFVSEFLGRSFTLRTCPVRTWSDGSDERLWARQITDTFIAAGFASPGSGNLSAAWADDITPEILARKLGIPLPHPVGAPNGWQELPA